MAYAASGLHRMAGASGVQLWIYQTTDAIAAINSAGYFNDAAGMMNVRDLVIVNRYGYEVARLNLTYANPDPESTCGENYQTIKDLIIDAR